MKTRMLSCLLCALFPVAHAADRESPPELALLVKLQGSAAKCHIDRGTAMAKARSIGTSSDYDQVLAATAKCVNAELPKGKNDYRDAVVEAPNSKPELARFYSAWMRYMDALQTMPDDGVERASHEFDIAASEIQALLDAQ